MPLKTMVLLGNIPPGIMLEYGTGFKHTAKTKSDTRLKVFKVDCSAISWYMSNTRLSFLKHFKEFTVTPENNLS